MPTEEKRSWKARILEELQKLSITFLYLWVLLTVFAIHRAVILAQYHISYPEKLGFALINAFVLAKFILIAEAFHAGERADAKPLFYSMIWKSAVFAVILSVCHILEDMLVGLWHGQPFLDALPSNKTSLLQVLATGILTFVVLIPFFGTRGLIAIIGKDEIKTLLFSTPSKGTAMSRER